MMPPQPHPLDDALRAALSLTAQQPHGGILQTAGARTPRPGSQDRACTIDCERGIVLRSAGLVLQHALDQPPDQPS